MADLGVTHLLAIDLTLQVTLAQEVDPIPIQDLAAGADVTVTADLAHDLTRTLPTHPDQDQGVGHLQLFAGEDLQVFLTGGELQVLGKDPFLIIARLQVPHRHIPGQTAQIQNTPALLLRHETSENSDKCNIF